MNLFETVKASVSVPDAAKMYGMRPKTWHFPVVPGRPAAAYCQ